MSLGIIMNIKTYQKTFVLLVILTVLLGCFFFWVSGNFRACYEESIRDFEYWGTFSPNTEIDLENLNLYVHFLRNLSYVYFSLAAICIITSIALVTREGKYLIPRGPWLVILIIGVIIAMVIPISIYITQPLEYGSKHMLRTSYEIKIYLGDENDIEIFTIYLPIVMRVQEKKILSSFRDNLTVVSKGNLTVDLVNTSVGEMLQICASNVNFDSFEKYRDRNGNYVNIRVCSSSLTERSISSSVTYALSVEAAWNNEFILGPVNYTKNFYINEAFIGKYESYCYIDLTNPDIVIVLNMYHEGMNWCRGMKVWEKCNGYKNYCTQNVTNGWNDLEMNIEYWEEYEVW